MNRRRITLTLGAFAGGLLAAAFLPLAPANADTTDIWAPDTSTFDPTSAPQGYPPFVDVLQGTETWYLTNPPAGFHEFLAGVDTQTIIGSFTNDDFLDTMGEGGTGSLSEAAATAAPDLYIHIDLANFGGGFENEWMSVPGVDGAAATITDTLITPFGDFTL